MTYQSTVLADSPTLLWPLNETSGTTAADATGNGHTGTYTGGYTQGAAGPLFQTHATTLNGSSGYVTSASTLAMSGAFSIEFWFKTTTVNTMICGDTDGGTSASRACLIDSSGYLVFVYWNSAFGSNYGPYACITKKSGYNDGNWHYVAGTIGSGGDLSLYVDGALAALYNAGGGAAYTWTEYLRAGNENASLWLSAYALTSGYFNGTLAAFAYYPAALSATQVTYHWDASGYAPSTPSITTPSIIPARASAAYSVSLAATGGTPSYTWSISSGSLPGWASLNSSTGVISGTASSSAGSTTFTVEVTDGASNTATQQLTLAVLVVAANDSSGGDDTSYVWSSPTQDPQITQNVSGINGSTPYVGPDAFGVPGGGTQDLFIYNDRNWYTTDNYVQPGGQVSQFVNNGFYYDQTTPIEDYAYIVSGWNQTMDWDAANIIASGCYDLWFTGGSPIVEFMIHHYIQNRGQGPYVATAVPFGGYSVNTSAGSIYIPLNYWNLAYSSGGSVVYWDIVDPYGNIQQPGLPSGAVDVLAMLKYLITPLGLWPGGGSVAPANTGFSHGYEVCATGGISHTFANNDFFWYGGLASPASSPGLLMASFP